MGMTTKSDEEPFLVTVNNDVEQIFGKLLFHYYGKLN